MPDRPATCPAHTDDHDPCTRPLGHRAHHETATGLAWFNTPRESPMSKHETSQAWNEQARIDHIQDQDRIIRRRNEEIREQVQVIESLRRGLEEVEQERDEARSRLAEATKEIREQGATIAELAAESHPLTPDAITDEARDRACRAVAALSVSDWDDMSDVAKGRAVALVEAVITEITRPEPPARPEGAERLESQIEAWDHEYGDDAIMTAPRLRELADFLAERGVRLVNGDE